MTSTTGDKALACPAAALLCRTAASCTDTPRPFDSEVSLGNAGEIEVWVK